MGQGENVTARACGIRDRHLQLDYFTLKRILYGLEVHVSEHNVVGTKPNPEPPPKKRCGLRWFWSNWVFSWLEGLKEIIKVVDRIGLTT